MKNRFLSLLLAATVLGGISATVFSTEASAARQTRKHYTVYDRQVELRKKTELGFKRNELTQKQCDAINHDLDEINSDVEKYKSNNGGKLSYKDEGKIENRLNKVSLLLQKKELQKRTTVH